MNYLKYLIYGLIQGTTEFLPISSTGHMKVISIIMGIDDPGPSLSAIFQLGSVFAILFYFRNEIFKFIRSSQDISSFFQSRIFKSILIANISIFIVGGLIKLTVIDFSNSFFRSNVIIGIVSIITALFMYEANKALNNRISINNHTLQSSFYIGLGQALAIVPGVSRSGITITTALLLGWKREDSARFSFLIGIPAITSAAIVELIHPENKYVLIHFGPILIGLITVFLTSLLAIKLLIRYVSFKGLNFFIFYKIIFGIFIIFTMS